MNERPTIPGQAPPASGVPLALFGGPASGKSFLFQAMVHRCRSRHFAGALTPLLGRGAIEVQIDGSGRNSVQAILQEYSSWQTLGSTLHDRPSFYRMSLPYSTGWLGLGIGRLVLELPDLAGEIYLQGQNGPSAAHWNRLAIGSRVVIFCLPFWVAFPGPRLAANDREQRRIHLEAYESVVQQVMAARRQAGAEKALLVLALTMADDRRCGLDELRDYWLPEADRVQSLLVRLRKMRALMTYLQDARKVSAYLEQCFRADPDTARLVELLDEGSSARPWLLPVSAVDRRFLEREAGQIPPPEHPPVPIHVELPLLLSLCEQTKALL